MTCCDGETLCHAHSYQQDCIIAIRNGQDDPRYTDRELADMAEAQAAHEWARRAG